MPRAKEKPNGGNCLGSACDGSALAGGASREAGRTVAARVGAATAGGSNTVSQMSSLIPSRTWPQSTRVASSPALPRRAAPRSRYSVA